MIGTDKSPTWYNDRPILFYSLRSVWESFWVLHNTRTVGFNGVNPISLQEIKAYIDLFSIEDISVFIEYICVLDREFLSWRDAESERQSKIEAKRSHNKK